MQVQQVAHPKPDKPFEHVMMNFSELTSSEGKKSCLVMVDMFLKWVEAFPTSKQDSSDNSKPFVSDSIKQIVVEL